MKIADYTSAAKECLIMPNTTVEEIQQKCKTLERLIEQIRVDDNASCISTIKDLFDKEAILQQWRFTDWNRDYFDDVEGCKNQHRELITMLTTGYNIVKRYENETKEQRLLNEKYLSILCNQDCNNAFFSYWSDDDKEDFKLLDPNIRAPYCINGTYNIWHRLKTHPIYRLYRSLREVSKKTDFENNCHTVCLYVVLSNELRELTQTYNQKIKNRQILSGRPQQSTGIPTELDTPEFKEILNKAINQGFVKVDNGIYKWKKSIGLCSFFIDDCNNMLPNIKRGEHRTIKPFCELFGYEQRQIYTAFADIKKGGASPIGEEEVKKLFN